MDIYNDEKYLTSETDISSYFEDGVHDLLDCGQGYYEESTTAFVKIDNKYYVVTINASIGSAKQDRGDRLYWVDEITSVTHEPITEAKLLDIRNSSAKSEIAILQGKIKTLEADIKGPLIKGHSSKL